MDVSDGTLVLGVRNGDRGAFAELYDRRARLIRAVCFDLTRDLHVAADLTQETFLRAYRNLDRLRDPQRFSSWLLGIARQVCREWRRAQRRRDRHMQLYGQHHAPAAGAAQEPPDERLAQVRAAVAGDGQVAGVQLKDAERLALHAFYLQGQDAEAARAVLGLSRSGFYRVLTAACQRLRRALAGREVPS